MQSTSLLEAWGSAWNVPTRTHSADVETSNKRNKCEPHRAPQAPASSVSVLREIALLRRRLGAAEARHRSLDDKVHLLACAAALLAALCICLYATLEDLKRDVYYRGRLLQSSIL